MIKFYFISNNRNNYLVFFNEKYMYHRYADGLIAQSVEHCTGIAEVMGSNLVQAWIFFQALILQLLKLCV